MGRLGAGGSAGRRGLGRRSKTSGAATAGPGGAAASATEATDDERASGCSLALSFYGAFARESRERRIDSTLPRWILQVTRGRARPRAGRRARGFAAPAGEAGGGGGEVGELAGALVAAAVAGDLAGLVGELGERGVLRPVAPLEDLGELGGDAGQAERAGRLFPARREVADEERALDLLDPARRLRLPAQVERRDAVAAPRARSEADLVERGHGVAGADLAGVDAVVAEVAVGDVAVLVAEQAPALDGARARTRPAPWRRAATVWSVPVSFSTKIRRASSSVST